MGGKSSKQKIRKSKSTKGDQTQNSKEPNESNDNGATYKQLRNETATEETEGKDAAKDAAKNEDTSEPVQQASEENPLRNVTTAESVAISSERTQVEAQAKDDTNSPKLEEKNKTESLVENSTKEKKAEAENVSSEASEELKSECSENVSLLELGTGKDRNDTDASAVHKEELNESSQKIEAGERESTPAPSSSHPLEAGAATSLTADVEETATQEKPVECEVDGLENNVSVVQPGS